MSETPTPPADLPRAPGPKRCRLLRPPILIIVVAVAAFGAGVLCQWLFSFAKPYAVASRPSRGAAQAEMAHRHGQPSAPAVQQYTCPMHTWIRLPDPDARCPICRMALVPVQAGGATSSFSETAKALMNIQTAPVERRFVSRTVDMVGKIDYDETRLKYITAWAPGRLDRLYVDYTGMAVKKGHHMVEMYSPQLITAQEEFIQAARTVKDLKDDDSRLIRESAKNNLQAAREKLRLLGLSREQVVALAAAGKPADHITINAPVSGIVTQRLAKEGQYVKTGSRIYALADLSHVWVRLDAYESDLIWLRYAQQVRFTSRAFPGKTFAGRISFISPTMNEKTRTVRVRVNAANERGELKPGMFVQAAVASDIDAEGNVIAPDLAGKWISPMHPEVVKDKPGKCDVCGMPLVRAESLGFAGVTRSRAAPPLTVFASAVLQTGKRAVVYVELPEADRPTYELREITLGPRAGSRYVVMKGLKEGELVVVRGTFKIDSDRQLRGQPSMMNLPAAREEKPARPPKQRVLAVAEPPAAFRAALGRVYEAYFQLADALASDNLGKALAAVRSGQAALKQVDAGGLSADAAKAWNGDAAALGKHLSTAGKTKAINDLRTEFHLISQRMRLVMARFGQTKWPAVHLIKCPMAFDNAGATWLQLDKTVRNPYLGAAMLRCGEIVETIQPVKTHPHEGHRGPASGPARQGGR